MHDVDRDAFGGALERLRAIEPTMVCSSHLPPAPGAMFDFIVDSLAMVPAADRFDAPERSCPRRNVGSYGVYPHLTGVVGLDLGLHQFQSF